MADVNHMYVAFSIRNNINYNEEKKGYVYETIGHERVICGLPTFLL